MPGARLSLPEREEIAVATLPLSMNAVLAQSGAGLGFGASRCEECFRTR